MASSSVRHQRAQCWGASLGRFKWQLWAQPGVAMSGARVFNFRLASRTCTSSHARTLRPAAHSTDSSSSARPSRPGVGIVSPKTIREIPNVWLEREVAGQLVARNAGRIEQNIYKLADAPLPPAD